MSTRLKRTGLALAATLAYAAACYVSTPSWPVMAGWAIGYAFDGPWSETKV